MNAYLKGNTKDSFMYTLVGLLTATNVMYAFKIGDTYISFLTILSVFIVIYNSFFQERLTNLKSIDRTVIIFIALSFLSVVQVVLYSNTFPGLFDKYIKGLISTLLYLVIYFAVIMRPDQLRAIIKGIKIGFIVNVIYCAYQYFGNSSNLPFTNLSSIFPQGDYGNELVYFNYVSGFFLEPAHLLRFFCGAFILTIIIWRPSYTKVMVIFLSFFVLLVSTSSLVIILVIGLLSYYIVMFFKQKDIKNSVENHYTISTRKIIHVSFIGCILLTVSLFVDWNSLFNFERYLKFIIGGVSLSEESVNYARATAIYNSLSLIPSYPIGAGLNSSATLMLATFPSAIVKGATFNGLITLMLELGIVGLVSYISIFVVNFKELVVNSKSKYEIVLVVALITTTICTILEGYVFSELIWVLLGICTVVKNRKK